MLQLRTGNRLQRRRAKKHFPRLTATQVQNQAALMEALQSAVPGTVIELASGDYGDLILNGNATPYLKYAGPEHVTITSADGNRGAVFSGVDVSYTNYLRFDGITVQKILGPKPPPSVPPGEFDPVLFDYNKQYSFRFSDNDHFHVVNCEFMGSVDGDSTNDPWGLWGGSNTNGLYENNIFHDLDKGLGLFGETDSVVRGNFFHDIQTDGMNFAGLTRVLIENNMGINWYPNYALSHPDFIQHWSDAGRGPSADVTIRGNIFIPGPGKGQPGHSPPQGIFIRDGQDQGISNLLIEQNFIHTYSAWGISVNGENNGLVDGVVIRNNTIVNDQFDTSQPANRAGIALPNGVLNIDAYDNVSTNMGSDRGVLVQHNDLINGNHYRDVFLAPYTMEWPPTTAEAAVAFLPMPGGPADGLGAQARLIEAFGAPVAWIERTVDDPLFAGKTITLHAADYLAGSVPTGPNVTFAWDFGDGSPVATTRTVEHTYADFGNYIVTLTVTDPDTSTNFETTRQVWVESAARLYLPFEQSTDNLGVAGGAAVWSDPAKEAYAARGDGWAAEFDGSSTSRMSINRETWWYPGMETLTVSVDVKVAPGSAAGRAVYHDGSAFGFHIGPTTANGWIKTGGLSAWVNGSGFGNLADGNWHTVILTYNSATGTASIYVDSVERGSRSDFVGPIVSGSASAAGKVSIGGWAGSSFTGQLDNVLVINGVVPPGSEPGQMDEFMAQYGGV